ncbi:MAG: glycosyltransferase family 2 protein [Planktomarina sp.]
MPVFSVIIASQERPDDLQACLASLAAQQGAPEFEVIVIGDAAAHSVLGRFTGPFPTIFLRDDRQNISVLRNIGIAAASGQICAFIDDDAIAKPDWLNALQCGFDQSNAPGGGGYVRARDGVSFQWTRRFINADGTCSDFTADGNQIIWAPKGKALKLEGTNMAFRKTALDTLGGFDEAFAFYMDETDLCYRAHKAGLKLSLFPQAEVIHKFTQGPRRKDDRTPKSLYDIGASVQRFLHKHTDSSLHNAALDELRSDQKKRLLRWMVSGHLEPRDVRMLLSTLEMGIKKR